jgi:uncharacterized membrane protein YeaQ/YmgE (transglycosylase-associated protein family)
MDIVIWVMAGALTGVLLHMLLTGKPLSEMGSVVTGATAALIGGWLLAPLIGVAELGEVNMAGLIVALISAVVGLSIVNVHHEDAEHSGHR